MKPAFDAGRPVPTVADETHGDEAETPASERGEAVRGVLQLIGQGRTASARLLRAEVLGLLLRTGNADSVAEIATRCRCTPRRVFSVLSEMRTFIGHKS
jgi:hypothetical protein